MKDITETLDRDIFTHFPEISPRGRRKSSQLQLLTKWVATKRVWLQGGVAALGIGAVLLLAFYLFFSQLAEYGWR